MGTSLDPSVFILVGSRLRQGLEPYRDTWDHKPPGIYLLNAVGQAAFPWLTPWLVTWLLTLVFTVAATLVLCRLLALRSSHRAAWAWSLVGCVGLASYPVALGGGLTESFAVLPLLWAMWLVAAQPRTSRNAIAIGAALSCACLFSLQSVPGAVAIGLVASFGSGVDPRRAAAVVVGGLPLVLAVSGWLFAAGAGADAVDQILTYNDTAYRASGTELILLLPLLILLFAGLLIPAATVALRALWHPRSLDPLSWAALLWVVLDVVYIAYEGRLFLHYLILIVPPMVVLAGQGMQLIWARVWSTNRRTRGFAISASVATVGAFLISVSLVVRLSGMAYSDVSQKQQQTAMTATWIQANTPAGATLFVWGNESQLFMSTGRPPHDRYVDIFAMSSERYWSAARTSSLLASWRSAPPGLIVEAPSSVPLFRPASGPADYSGPDQLDPLREFVRSHYRLAASFDQGDSFNDVYLPNPGS